jgi:hypothetical protein
MNESGVVKVTIKRWGLTLLAVAVLFAGAGAAVGVAVQYAVDGAVIASWAELAGADGTESKYQAYARGAFFVCRALVLYFIGSDNVKSCLELAHDKRVKEAFENNFNDWVAPEEQK